MSRFFILLFAVCLCCSALSMAQGSWKVAPVQSTSSQKLKLAPTAIHPEFTIEEPSFKAKLAALPYKPVNAQIIALPMPDGSMKNFRVWQTKLLPDALAAKYPGIKTFNAEAVGNPSITAKLDLTLFGFHAMVFDGAKTFFIDKSKDSASNNYIVHYKKDERRPAAERMKCLVPGHERVDIAAEENNRRAYRTTNGNQLRTYRLALSCDHQYARAAVERVGPTVAQTLSAMTTTMNRINGVYERELSVTLVMVPNEDLLIFVDSAGDPFGLYDQDPNALLDSNQAICDRYIGTANYDIGHIFSTGGGGLSQLGCTCQPGLKAQSVTGSPSPSGDGFDIDYVAHEMGHEVGSNHTFNNNLDGSCNGNAVPDFAFQPGSGSTIMDYAGICGSDDIQPHSDAYFSGSSLLQIQQFINSASGGDGCAVKTSTGNKPVSLPAFSASYSIPFLTPFELTAPAATDSVTDTSVTYCWEQWDLGDFGMELKNTFYYGPIFRSYTPTSSTTRVFPNIVMVLADSLSNAGTEDAEGEKAPDVARSLNFRLTVRDIYQGNGCFLFPDDSIHLDAINTGTGFRVTSQDVPGQVYIGTQKATVTWDVAQTTSPPINTSNVDIYLSEDGGYTWPDTLGNFPNTGSAEVTIPNMATTPDGRIKVKGTGNVFFNINTADMNIINYPGHTGDVLIFPVPAHDVLYILTGVAGTSQAAIYDAIGKRVWTGNITGVAQLNIADLPRGIYMLWLTGENGEKGARKFVVR